MNTKVLRGRHGRGSAARNAINPRLKKGLIVTMSDGWVGRIESDSGDTVVCIQVGYSPNDHLKGYRAFARKCLSISGGKITVAWNGDNTTPVIDINRARLEREWQNALD